MSQSESHVTWRGGPAGRAETGRWGQKYADEKQAVLRMEFKTFLNAFIRLPCQGHSHGSRDCLSSDVMEPMATGFPARRRRAASSDALLTIRALSPGVRGPGIR